MELLLNGLSEWVAPAGALSDFARPWQFRIGKACADECCSACVLVAVPVSFPQETPALREGGVVVLSDQMAADPRGPKLFVGAVFTSYRRSKRQVHPNQALLKIDGVFSKEEAQFYVGKVVHSSVNAKGIPKGTINPGIVLQPHGNNGIVRAKFSRNLPPHLLGTKVRVYLYPSKI